MPQAFYQRGRAQPIAMFEQGFPRATMGLGVIFGPFCPSLAACHRFVPSGQDVFVVERAAVPAAEVRGIKVARLPDGIQRPTIEGLNDRPTETNIVELVLGAVLATNIVTSIPMFLWHLPSGHFHHGLNPVAGFLDRHFRVKAMGEIQGILQRRRPRSSVP